MDIQHRGGDDWRTISTDEDESRREQVGEDEETEVEEVEEEDDKETTETKSEAESEYREVEQNVCKGTAELEPDPKRKAKKTAGVYGIGEILSGRYFTEKIENRFTRRGYKQTADFSKTGFKDKLESEEIDDNYRPEKGEANLDVTEHTVSKGETLWSISKRVYGTGSEWEKIAKANEISKSEVDELQVGRKLVIPE